ncbi:hypothetical protein BBP40_007246 [Aspergillus hancockii]|nr:hypothetical protein BBP40_007246 [Aspergillus hancockii]
MDIDNSEWASEPIAVIGMNCNFSGGASNPRQALGLHGFREDRLERDPRRPTQVKGGHFLPFSQGMGSQTSVFAGVFTHDYQEGIIRDEDRLPRFNVVGTWSPCHPTASRTFLTPVAPGRGEGVATIIIKRLSDALAANDPIRAVIRETALNHDGKIDTITTLSGAAQVEHMRECYRRAGLDPRGTQYLEAHGTGAPTGDPIEAGAMAAIFGGGEGRNNEEHYLHVGSVKNNVGYTGAASGLAAIVKGVLCLEKGFIPPTVNYETPNPKLKLKEWRLKVVRTMEQWPDSLINSPHRISINNFGYGGANAHVILECADPWTLTLGLDLNPVNGNSSHSVNGNGHVNRNSCSYHTNDTTGDTKVLILSARDERGCQQMVSDLKAYLEKRRSLGHWASEQLLRSLSYTLGESRTLFPWVAALQVRLEKDGTLDAATQALDSPRFKPGRRASDSPRIGMDFTGQGAQWVHATKISIPVCVALQIALVRLLEAWGITPSAAASHSSGEIAAAFAVGTLTHRPATTE